MKETLYGTHQKYDRHLERFSEMCLRCSFLRKSEGFFHKLQGFFHELQGFFPRIGRFFSKEVEGFFQRALGSYTNKLPKRRAALLTDPLELCLCLLDLHLCLLGLRLCLPSCVFNRKAKQQWKGFHKRISLLKRRIVYGIYSWETQGSNLHVSIPFFLNSF